MVPSESVHDVLRKQLSLDADANQIHRKISAKEAFLDQLSIGDPDIEVVSESVRKDRKKMQMLMVTLGQVEESLRTSIGRKQKMCTLLDKEDVPLRILKEIIQLKSLLEVASSQTVKLAAVALHREHGAL